MNINFLITLVSSFVVVFMGALVFFHDKKSTTNKLFLLISLVTVFWSLSNFFSLEPKILPQLIWARLVLFCSVPHLVLFYFFIKNFPHRHFSFKNKDLVMVSSVGVLMMLLVLTNEIFSAIEIVNGTSMPVPGRLIPIFASFMLLIFLVTTFIMIKKYIKAELQEKRSWRVLLLGFVTSYLLIILTNFILVNFNGDTRFIIYGPLFMLPSVMGTAYSILRYRLFNVKVFTTEIIVFVLLLVTLVQIFFSQGPQEFIVNTILFVVLLVVGLFLIKSVLHEVEQKEKLAELNTDLQKTIEQREALEHLITHKVKGAFTRSKAIFAEMLEGTFGEIPDILKKMAYAGLESDDGGIKTVDLILNATNLRNGTIKFDMKVINMRDVVNKALESKKIAIEDKKLEVEKNIPEGEFLVHGDSFWLGEAAHNLIENAIVYTPIGGKFAICLRKEGKKVVLCVRDSGVGLSDEDKEHLFTQGGRGKDSLKVNVNSTGYGLYSVKLILDAHKGRIWAESEGRGKGSTFYIELNSVT